MQRMQALPRKLTLALAAALLLAGIAALALWRWRGPEVPVAAVRLAPLVQSVVFSARVASPSRVFVGSTVTGRVAEVPLREGALLKTGDLVVRLEDAEWAAAVRQAEAALTSARARLQGQQQLTVPVAHQQLLQARANAEAAARELERNQSLFAQGFIGQARLDEARRATEVALAQLRSAEAQQDANRSGSELAQVQARVQEAEAALDAARARLAQARVLAPGDAVLLQRLVEPGQIVQPGTRLAELSLRQSPQLVAQVDEKFLGQLAIGQLASVVADAFPARPFDARVASIAPLVDAQRGAVEVKFALPSPPDFLRDDLTVSVEVVTARRERALVLPAEGLRPGPTVLVLADGRIESRSIRTGLRSLAEVEVLQGLREGELVVLDGVLAPGTRARPAAAAPRNGRSGGGDGAAALTNAMGR